MVGCSLQSQPPHSAVVCGWGWDFRRAKERRNDAAAAMTLDVHADLFDDDLEILSKALNDARANSDVST
jgi:hypothetical protein